MSTAAFSFAWSAALNAPALVRSTIAKETTIANLRRLLFGATSEKTRTVFAGDPTTAPGAAPDTGAEPEGPAGEGVSGPAPAPPKRRRGHGRTRAAAYTGGETIVVAHQTLQTGTPCPECAQGKVYRLAEPGMLVRIVGQAPLTATVYALEKLRGNLCGEVFTAPVPPGVGAEKYDASAASMIATLKYGRGLPFHRLEKLQGNPGIPLPAATQWEILDAAANTLAPPYTELIRQAAHGEVVHNDDTTMRILALMGPPHRAARPEPPAGAAARTGLFTSGIVAKTEGLHIALFFTGTQHAGENLARVLAQRAQGLGPPIQMCDALARNLPAALQTIVANCLAHGRRKFVEQAANFPEECRHVLDVLGKIYRHDAVARERNLLGEERRQFHQDHSQALMDGLQPWLEAQLAEWQVEPNSGLGQAIRYLLTHWAKLTRFLTVPGAPLDNNVCERALNKVILHRKNALFYKTTNGARVGDLFMSLIHTAELAGANAFHYLTELQRHAGELAQNPGAWLPWNYTATLDRAGHA